MGLVTSLLYLWLYGLLMLLADDVALQIIKSCRKITAAKPSKVP